MLRWLIVLGGAMAVLAFDVQPLLAADGDGWPILPFYRGSGSYFSLWKLAAVWLLFLLWVRTTDWISQDSQTLKLRWALWDALAFFTFFLLLLLFWALPWFSLGYVLLLVGYAAPLIAYIVHRNKQVKSSYDKVLTPRHLRRYMARKLSVIGINLEGADDVIKERGPDIQFSAQGAESDRDNNVNLLTARQSPGYVPARELVYDMLLQRATHAMLDFATASVGVRFQVDGVWAERPPMERELGDAILEVLKRISALNVENRRARQSGVFGVQAGKDKLTCKITTQGTQSGERALLHLQTKKVEFNTLDDIGMRSKMQEQIMAALEGVGLVVVSALPSGGLTTTLDVLLSNTDRYMRNFTEVGDVDKPDRDIENVHVTTYSSAQGETAATVLPRLIRSYPDVIVVRELTDLETLSILCDQAGENRLLLAGTRAKDAPEALLRLMMLKIPPAEFAAAIMAVLNVRLIRKLCEKCKEGFAPAPEVLKQLGLPAGRVETLYRPPTAPIDPKHPDVVCDQCQGSGYYGRTAIFELLLIDDTIRQVLTTAPKIENIRAAARKGKQRGLQEEGVLLVARGVTSIPELLRVLKQ